MDSNLPHNIPNQSPQSFWRKSWSGPKAFFLWLTLIATIASGGTFSLCAIFAQRGEREFAFSLALMIAVLSALAFVAFFFVRWLMRPGNRTRTLFAVACLMTIGALAWTEENWRGKRAWENYRAERMAHADPMDWEHFLPARVPDEENFAKTPFLQAVGIRNKVDTNVWKQFSGFYVNYNAFQGSFDGGELIDLKKCQEEVRSSHTHDLPPLPQEPAADILATFKKTEPIINELHQASLRPSSQFILSSRAGFDLPIPHFVACRSISQALATHAVAELGAGNNDEAFRDFYTMHQLANGLLNSDPILVSTMVGISIDRNNAHVFWEGWARGKWSDEQYEKFQKIFGQMNFLKNFDRSIRGGERNWIVNSIEGTPLRKLLKNASVSTPLVYMPQGWIYQNLLTYARGMQMLERLVDVEQQRVFPKVAGDAIRDVDVLTSGYSPFKYLARLAIPNFSKASQTVVRIQTQMNLAMLVCALERYRHSTGAYPETLDALKPQFIETIPHDIIGGEPLKYRRTSDGRFLLYSVGWNEKDDGGIPGAKQKYGSVDLLQGDWVWSFPSKTP